MKPVWIDTDTGIDDALALLAAFKLNNIEVVGVSTSFGNVELKKTFKNARNVLSLGGQENVPVYKGAERPIMVEKRSAANVHGEDGLGGVAIPDSKASINKENAVDALYACAKKYEGELRIAAVAPLTNIAACILKYPDFPKYVKEIAIMGGSIAVGGNANTAAEFNILGDPHAAQLVFKAGMNLTLFPLDVTMFTCLTKDEVDKIGSFDNKVADFIFRSSQAPLNLYQMLGLGAILCLHDTCPLLYFSDPTLFKGKQAGVYVETQSEISLGRTISDLYVHTDEMLKKNATIMLESDRNAIAEIIVNIFKNY